ncbi:MAG: hypothetical protein GY803_24770 [Chloroflexi bacterium]|nr:hypothetical protein [Chloroflexota bacterium]
MDTPIEETILSADADVPITSPPISSADETISSADANADASPVPAKKQRWLWIGIGLVFLAIIVRAGFIIVGTLKNEPEEVAGQEPDAVEEEQSAEPVEEASDLPPTPIILFTPTPLPIPTALPSLTPIPEPVMVSISSPHIVPFGLPRTAAWAIKADAPATVRIVDFGGAMLVASNAAGEVVTEKQVSPDIPWTITGLIDPQMGSGTLVLEITTPTGMTESVSLGWRTTDVTAIENGQTVVSVDGQTTEEPPLAGETSAEGDDNNAHSLSDGILLTVESLPDDWQMQPSAETLFVHFTADKAPDNQAIIALFKQSDAVDTSDPGAVLDFLLDASDGAGGVTSYGELTLEQTQDTHVSGYPAKYVRVHTTDDTLFGYISAISVNNQAIIIEAFSASSETIDTLGETAETALTIVAEDAN